MNEKQPTVRFSHIGSALHAEITGEIDHHTAREILDIFDNITDKSGLMEALMEMYAETLSALTESNNNEGNVTWTLVR